MARLVMSRMLLIVAFSIVAACSPPPEDGCPEGVGRLGLCQEPVVRLVFTDDAQRPSGEVRDGERTVGFDCEPQPDDPARGLSGCWLYPHRAWLDLPVGFLMESVEIRFQLADDTWTTWQRVPAQLFSDGCCYGCCNFWVYRADEVVVPDGVYTLPPEAEREE